MKIISYVFSSIFALVFLSLLVIFHPLQWISVNLFGSKGHSKMVACLNFSLTKSLLLLGVPVRLINNQKLPENTTIIFVSNHQSTFEVAPLGYFFRKYNAKFVSKIELGKGIPSVSYNLKKGGAALINRKDPKQAISELMEFAKRINKNKWSAVIFPEGYIVPVTINNSWKVFKHGKFPLGLGSPITITTHHPIKIDSLPFDELIAQTEKVIKEHIKQ